ncbi:MAG: hypothetical protein ACYTGX_04540 [Planctomycetota bacterium]
MSNSRPHHYTFAHRATPGAFWRDPAEFVAALCSESGQEIVTNVWNAIGADIEQSGAGEALASDGLHVTPTELDGREAAIISLPAPEVMTEAWFIAVVAPTPYVTVAEGEAPDARYFTLEKTLSLAPDGAEEPDMDLAVLCEWTHDGTHANTSVIVPASLERFEVAVLERL